MNTILRPTILLAFLACSCASKAQVHFETADEAARQLVEALRADNLAQAEEILGPGSKDLLYSGDEVADKNGRQKFVPALRREAPDGEDERGRDDPLRRRDRLAGADPDHPLGRHVDVRHRRRRGGDDRTAASAGTS